MAQTNPRNVEYNLSRLVEAPGNSPILIDTCVVASFSPEIDIISLLRSRGILDIPLRIIKDLRHYLSILYSLIEEQEKITTVKTVIPEAFRGIELKTDEYASVSYRYHNVTQPWIAEKKGREAQDRATLDRLAGIRQIISKTERIAGVLRDRAQKYVQANGQFTLFREKIEAAAYRVKMQGIIERVSKADVDLVTAGVYECFEGNNPVIISMDRDLDEIVRDALSSDSFNKQSREVSTRLKIYTNYRRVF